MSPALVWTLLSAIGAVVAAWSAVDAWHDLRALGSSGDGRRRIAFGYLRGELIHVLILSAWAVIGFLALEAARNQSWTPGTAVLVGSLALLVLRSILDAIDRLAGRRDAYPPLDDHP